MHLFRASEVHQMEEWSFVQPKVDARRRRQLQEMQGWRTVKGEELPVGDEKKESHRLKSRLIWWLGCLKAIFRYVQNTELFLVGKNSQKIHSGKSVHFVERNVNHLNAWIRLREYAKSDQWRFLYPWDLWRSRKDCISSDQRLKLLLLCWAGALRKHSEMTLFFFTVADFPGCTIWSLNCTPWPTDLYGSCAIHQDSNWKVTQSNVLIRW